MEWQIHTDPAPYQGKQCVDYDGKNHGGWTKGWIFNNPYELSNNFCSSTVQGQYVSLIEANLKLVQCKAWPLMGYSEHYFVGLIWYLSRAFNLPVIYTQNWSTCLNGLFFLKLCSISDVLPQWGISSEQLRVKVAFCFSGPALKASFASQCFRGTDRQTLLWQGSRPVSPGHDT